MFPFGRFAGSAGPSWGADEPRRPAPRQQPHLQPHQIKQVEFARLQGGAIGGGHQQLVAHQGLGGLAAVDAGDAHHKELLAGQLAAAAELHGLGRPALGLQPAGATAGEALGEVGEGEHPQLTPKPLGAHQATHHEQLGRRSRDHTRGGSRLGRDGIGHGAASEGLMQMG